MEPPFHFVAWSEHGCWVASCVEYDIAAQGPDCKSALDRLELAIQLEREESLLRTGVPFGAIGPPPQNVTDRYRTKQSGLLEVEMAERAVMWGMK